MIQFIAIGIGIIAVLVLIKKIMKRPVGKFSKFCGKCGQPKEKNICIKCGQSEAIEFGR